MPDEQSEKSEKIRESDEITNGKNNFKKEEI
jgi:hypothetical protein